MKNINKLFAQRNFARAGVEFYFIQKNHQTGTVFHSSPVVMSEVDDNGFMPEPTFSMTDDECQEFINFLWDNGFRPSKADNQGTMDAQSKHLDDMRKIAFMFLENKDA
jgi:hypothetical protein